MPDVTAEAVFLREPSATDTRGRPVATASASFVRGSAPNGWREHLRDLEHGASRDSWPDVGWEHAAGPEPRSGFGLVVFLVPR